MLPIVTALGSTSPAGVSGVTFRPAVWTPTFGSALRWVSPPAILTCSCTLRLVSPTTLHFHVWFSYRGLAPHLHRAHAGHTQSDPPNPRPLGFGLNRLLRLTAGISDITP